MKNKLAVIVATLALALTVSISEAQTTNAPPINPNASTALTSAQFNAMVLASGVTLISGQTVQGFTLSSSPMAPLPTPICMEITYVPLNGSTLTQRVMIPGSALSAIVAAGPAIVRTNYRRLIVGFYNGSYGEVVQ